MGNKYLSFAAIAGAVALLISSAIWYKAFSNADSVGVHVGESSCDECNCDVESEVLPEKEPVKTPVQDLQETVNCGSWDEKSSKSDGKTPIKENDKNWGRVIKNKVDVPLVEQMDGSEVKNHIRESEKDLVEGRFGTHFESDYGE